MVQILICLSATAIFSVLAFFYMKKWPNVHRVSMIIAMTICLVALCLVQFKCGTKSIVTYLESITAVAICFPACWIDIKERKIPNEIVATGLAVRVLLYISLIFISTAELTNSLKTDFVGFLVIGIFCIISRFIVKDGMGMGDVKLLLVIALLLGVDGVMTTMILSLVVAFFMGLYELIVKKQKKNATIPFAPAILAGVYLTAILSVF